MTDRHRAVRPDRLSIDQRTVNDIWVITLHGEIDHDVKNALSQVLSSGAGATPPRTVVDLSGVTFMDSSGINAFIVAHRQMSDAQGWLRLAGAQESVLRILQIVGLDRVIDCHPTLDQALTA
ncbi:MAG TPA: STAS domain-containing protein [Streptomyces sp.]|nr:STAS domain-containing protein [Streptomyces sp.]